MAANIFASSDDTPNGEVNFDKPVDYLNIFVNTGVACAISLDKGANYLTVPSGFHSFRIGPTKSILVQADGVWQLIAVQA
jgi:hypothetical protein